MAFVRFFSLDEKAPKWAPSGERCLLLLLLLLSLLLLLLSHLLA